jgi:hypothetical protein
VARVQQVAHGYFLLAYAQDVRQRLMVVHFSISNLKINDLHEIRWRIFQKVEIPHVFAAGSGGNRCPKFW